MPGPVIHAQDTETNKTLSLFFRVLVQIGDLPINQSVSTGGRSPSRELREQGLRTFSGSQEGLPGGDGQGVAGLPEEEAGEAFRPREEQEQ